MLYDNDKDEINTQRMLSGCVQEMHIVEDVSFLFDNASMWLHCWKVAKICGLINHHFNNELATKQPLVWDHSLHTENTLRHASHIYDHCYWSEHQMNKGLQCKSKVYHSLWVASYVSPLKASPFLAQLYWWGVCQYISLPCWGHRCSSCSHSCWKWVKQDLSL